MTDELSFLVQILLLKLVFCTIRLKYLVYTIHSIINLLQCCMKRITSLAYNYMEGPEGGPWPFLTALRLQDYNCNTKNMLGIIHIVSIVSQRVQFITIKYIYNCCLLFAY